MTRSTWHMGSHLRSFLRWMRVPAADGSKTTFPYRGARETDRLDPDEHGAAAVEHDDRTHDGQGRLWSGNALGVMTPGATAGKSSACATSGP